MKNIRTPPRVKWYRRSDREKTRNHAVVKANYQKMICDLWARIPPSARTLILSPHVRLKGIFLVQEDPADNNCCFMEHAGALFDGEERAIYLNVEWDLGTSSKKRWTGEFYNFMTALLVHELAHVFLTSLMDFARSGAEKYLQRARPKSGKRAPLSPGEQAILDATEIGYGPGLFALDEGKTKYISPTLERYVESIVLAWGFGYEYANAIVTSTGGPVPTSKSMSHEEDSYLRPEILLIRELLNDLHKSEPSKELAK